MGRELATAVIASVPLLAALVLERALGAALDDFLAWEWAPLVLLVVVVLVALGWVRVRRALFRTATAEEYQVALDKTIDRIYVLPPANRPSRGISTEGMVLDHAPENFRRDEYVKLGLPEPRPHRSQRR